MRCLDNLLVQKVVAVSTRTHSLLNTFNFKSNDKAGRSQGQNLTPFDTNTKFVDRIVIIPIPLRRSTAQTPLKPECLRNICSKDTCICTKIPIGGVVKRSVVDRSCISVRSIIVAPDSVCLAVEFPMSYQGSFRAVQSSCGRSWCGSAASFTAGGQGSECENTKGVQELFHVVDNVEGVKVIKVLK